MPDRHDDPQAEPVGDREPGEVDSEPASGEIYQNEFAMVEVARHETETGPRLRIRDLASGAEVFLDPVELESLTRWRHEDFAPLVDPSELVPTTEPDPDQV